MIALDILRSALDSDNSIDKTAILLAASSIISKLSKDVPEYIAFMAAFNNQASIDLDAMLNMLIAQQSNIWNFLNETFTLQGLASRPWYRSKWFLGVGFFCDQSVDIGKKITFTFSSKYNVDLHHVKTWIEKHEGEKVKLTQYNLENQDNIKLEEIEDVDCFKQNPNLKFLYLETAESEDEFRVKPNIDYASIEREDYPRQSEFILSEKDIKSIIKFLKKHEKTTPASSTSNIVAHRGNGKKQELKHNNITYIILGDSIEVSNIRNTQLQNGITYVRFIFDDIRGIEICYKYDNKNEILVPCHIQYNGERHFANSNYLVEYGYKEAPVEDEGDSWYKKAWNGFANWCSGIWNSMCQCF